MIKEEYDIAILGAGPAGAACALALRDSGLRVCLIDRFVFPRDKICGDAIPGPALKELKKLLGEEMHELHDLLPKQKITKGSIITAQGRQVTFNWKTEAYNSPRLAFDAFLLSLVKKYSNTVMREGVSIKSIERTQNEVLLRSKDGELLIKAALVIGCDGAHSLVAKEFDMKFDPAANCVALRAYYRGVLMDEECNEVYLLDEKVPGYFWIFPLSNGMYNVGLGFLSRGDTKAHIPLRRKLEQLINNREDISRKFKNAEAVGEMDAYRLPLGGIRASISGERFMLTGDAAYLVDPLQGHGIDTAMRSGHLAGIQALKCFEKQNFSATFMKAYDISVYDALGTELKKSYLAMKWFHRLPWLAEALVSISANKRVKEFLQKRIL